MHICYKEEVLLNKLFSSILAFHSHLPTKETEVATDLIIQQQQEARKR